MMECEVGKTSEKAFSKNKRFCKNCYNERMKVKNKKWRMENPEKKKKSDKQYRENNKDKINEYWRKNRDKKRLKDLKYYMKRKLSGNPIKTKPVPASKETRLKNRKKIIARRILNCELIKGTIKKEKCEVCKSEKVEAHHKDYNKPLEVIWLCHKHHREHHRPRFEELKHLLPKELGGELEDAR